MMLKLRGCTFVASSSYFRFCSVRGLLSFGLLPERLNLGTYGAFEPEF